MITHKEITPEGLTLTHDVDEETGDTGCLIESPTAAEIEARTMAKIEADTAEMSLEQKLLYLFKNMGAESREQLLNDLYNKGA
jgi:hypothetical protein